METFLFLLFVTTLVVVIVAIVKSGKKKRRPAGQHPTRSTPPSLATPSENPPSRGGTQWRADPSAPWQANPSSEKASKHVVPTPTGTPTEPWSGTRRSIEIVGENYREGAFPRLMGKAIARDGGVEIDDPAALVDDSRNPYDSNAVAVFVRGEHVGYLDRPTAREYHDAVANLAELGKYLVVPARTWARSDGRRVYARVTIWAPDPAGILPINELPRGAHVVIPAGSAIQVTKEDEHMGALAPWLDHDTERPIAVTLHTVHEQRARSSVETVEIRLDDQRVGILSPTQAANMLPLIKHVEERGLLPVARASLRGNELKADVVLNVAKAQDVNAAWIIALGPAQKSDGARTTALGPDAAPEG